MSEIPVPRHIHRADDELAVSWDEDHVGHYPARWLRLRCHCASCREEMTGAALLDPETVPDDVRPLVVELVGTYAIRIDWSDGHGTGIYPYRYLREICPCDRCAADRPTG